MGFDTSDWAELEQVNAAIERMREQRDRAAKFGNAGFAKLLTDEIVRSEAQSARIKERIFERMAGRVAG